MWMEEKIGTRVNAERTRQALDTGAEAVATACPFCLVMLADGLADAGPRARSVRAMDISEVLAAALAERPAGAFAEGPAAAPSGAPPS